MAMTLRLKSLKISGFLSYLKEVSVELDSGVIAIIGENGSGKSSFVDAIYYSLTQPQQALRASKKADLVNKRSPRARITLELVDDMKNEEVVYTIESIIDRKGSSQVVLRRNKRVEASGVKAVKERLSEILGIEKARLENVIGSSVVIRQGGLDNIIYLLSSGENRERIKFFENVFGLTEYSKAKDLMGELSVVDVKIKNTQYSLAPTRTWRKEVNNLILRLRKEKKELKEKLENLKAKQNEYEKLKVRLENEVETLREKVDELNRFRGRALALEDRAKKLNEEISELESELNSKLTRLENIKAELATLSNIINCAQYHEKATRYYELSGKISKMLLDLKKLEEIKEALEFIKYNKGVEEKFEKIRASLAEVKEEHRKLQKELGEVEGRFKELENQKRRIFKNIMDIIKNKLDVSGDLKNIIAKIDDTIDTVQLSLQKIMEEISSKEERLQAFKAKKSLLETRVSELENSLALLKDSKESKCPLCGAPLTLERKVELMNKFALELQEFRKDIDALGRKIKVTERRLQELRNNRDLLMLRLNDLKKARDSLVNIMETIGPLENRRRSIKEKLELLSQRVKKLEEEYDDTIKRLQEFDKAKKIVAEYDSSLLKDPESSLESLARTISSIDREVSRFSEEVRRLEEELKNACKTTSLEQALNLINNSLEKLKDVEKLEKEKNSLEQEIFSHTKLLEEKRRELKKISSELDELKSKEKALAIAERNYQVKSKELKDLLEKLSRLSQEILSVEDRIREIDESIKNIEDAKFKLEILTYIRDVVFEKVPRFLFLEYLAKLEDLMSEILSKFDLSYNAVSIKVEKDFDLISIMAVNRDGTPVPLGVLSGGERTAIALAFVLALNALLARKTGFLVLDEPTNNLDEERRKVLINILKIFKGGERIPQLIVVSHDRDVIEAADMVFEVTKGPQGSLLKPLGEQLM